MKGKRYLLNLKKCQHTQSMQCDRLKENLMRFVRSNNEREHTLWPSQAHMIRIPKPFPVDKSWAKVSRTKMWWMLEIVWIPIFHHFTILYLTYIFCKEWSIKRSSKVKSMMHISLSFAIVTFYIFSLFTFDWR